VSKTLADNVVAYRYIDLAFYSVICLLSSAFKAKHEHAVTPWREKGRGGKREGGGGKEIRI